MWLTFGKVGRGGGDSKLVAKTLRPLIHCFICQVQLDQLWLAVEQWWSWLLHSQQHFTMLHIIIYKNHHQFFSKRFKRSISPKTPFDKKALEEKHCHLTKPKLFKRHLPMPSSSWLIFCFSTIGVCPFPWHALLFLFIPMACTFVFVHSHGLHLSFDGHSHNLHFCLC